ncbi:MAG: hypothetical protein DRN54_02365 [Thaumarchaeota archaeon]|nr:MAG: hypothetical protein DRJ62_03590 [Thermoprotei archaeon]RLG03740.1 MAG: hypothetical protein DRN54_02365 [Nitrososphaerota archaeon]
MLERHVKKMKEIAVLLGLVARELKEICEELKAASATSPKPREAEAEGEQKIEVQKETGPLTLGKVQSMFPENLLSKLYFEDAGDSIIIRPRSYLGDEFREVAEIACDRLGGVYIGAGKNSHFKIPKE